MAFAVLADYTAGSTNFVKYSQLDKFESYEKVTNMDLVSGQCSTGTAQKLSGSIAPFDEDFSVHIRGPFNLKLFAVYSFNSTTAEEKPDFNTVTKRNWRAHHKHKRNEDDVEVVSETVTVTVIEPTGLGKRADYVAGATSTASAAASTSSADNWQRVSYYDAKEGTSDNVVFTNHNGKFNSHFGNALGYCDSTGRGNSTEPVVLADTTFDSDQEIVLFSNETCTAETCGYWREDGVGKKGWDGDYKVIVFNITMPNKSSGGNNDNLPAIWLLNGQIPRTEQYGECSCWKSGCGEFDLFEAIPDTPDYKLTNQIHANPNTGTGYYFNRPANNYTTFAAIFHGTEIYLKSLDNFDFGSSISSATVQSWVSGTGYQTNTW